MKIKQPCGIQPSRDGAYIRTPRQKVMIRKKAIPAGTFLFAILFFGGISCFRWFSFPLDDAWIHRVYSHSFAYGHGFQYNQGGAQEAGSTSPLWAIVTSPAHWFDPLGTGVVILIVKLFAIALGLGCVLIIQGIVENLFGSVRAGVLSSVLFSVDPGFLFSVFSGMENPLVLFLWLSGFYLLLNRRLYAAGSFFGLCAVARPEALIVCLFFFLFIIFDTTASVKKKTGALFLSVLPFAACVLFCLCTTHHVFPNTFYIKAHPFHWGHTESITAVREIMQQGWAHSPVFFAGIALFFGFLFMCQKWKSILAVSFFIFAPLVYLCAVVGSRDFSLTGYYWRRWVDPPVLIMTAAFCIGFAVAVAGCINGERPAEVIRKKINILGNRGRIFLSAIIILALVFATSSLVPSFQERRWRLESDSRIIHILNVEPGQWIAQNTPSNAIVGVNDAGAIRYFGKRRTIDLMGLNNSDITFGRKNRKQEISESSWLAVYPSWFSNFNLASEFRERMAYHIPFQEYTICDCPSQTTIVIFEKKQ